MQQNEISCKKCGGIIKLTETEPGRDWLQCGWCGTVFRIAGNVTGSIDYDDDFLPDNITITRDNNDIRIVFRWYSHINVLNLVVAIALDIFEAYWNALFFKWGIVMILMFGIPNFIAGFGIFYWALAGLVNKAVLTVSKTVRIKSGPLPWYGNRKLEKAQFRSVYCRQKDVLEPTGTKQTYEIRAVLSNNRDIKLLSRITMPEQALYIEQEIEKCLGIADQRVYGDTVSSD